MGGLILQEFGRLGVGVIIEERRKTKEEDGWR
jgi:hypothetical protein